MLELAAQQRVRGFGSTGDSGAVAVAGQIQNSNSGAATGGCSLPAGREGRVQAALCGPSAANIARAGRLKVLSAAAQTINDVQSVIE